MWCISVRGWNKTVGLQMFIANKDHPVNYMHNVHSHQPEMLMDNWVY